MVKIDYIIGDSIAAGIAIAGFKLKRSGSYGVKSSDDKGISKVGAPPSEVLGFLNEVGKDKLKSKNVILSSGISNGPSKISVVEQELQLLKDINAQVFVIGVSNNPPSNLSDLVGMNAKLEVLVKKFGFTFLGGFEPTSDKVHPASYDKYYKNHIVPVLEGTVDKTNSDAKNVSITPDNTTNTPGTQSGTQSIPKTEDVEITLIQSPQVEVISANRTSINGKIILKVKSGPGVIIGDTERDIENGEVTFKGIEFDQPGEYVISVTSTSPDINPLDFNVTVLSESLIIEQEPSKDKDDKKPTDGPRPIIAQIDQAKIDLPAMTFATTESSVDNELVAGQIGLTPFFNYMGSTIRDKDISSLKLYHDGIIPVIQIIFADTNNIIKSTGFPQDDTKFEFFLNSRSENIKSIHLKFKIEEFTSLKNGKYSIYGTLDISELYRMRYQTYNGTSFEVLKKIASELKLGFNSNITNTDDKMAWRNVGDKQHNFIESVIKHSYLSDKSYMVGFIDYYYCFNYVDVEKENNRDITKDMCIDSGGFDDGSVDDNAKLSPLVLTTDKSNQQSNCLIEEKSFENNSTSLGLDKGYMTKTKSYDRTQKMFLVFDVDSTTSDQSQSMILKGSEGDKEGFNNNVSTTYTGKIDTDNVHKNYNYAVTQNKINIDNLNKIRMLVSLPNPNYNIYLYQKVTVTIINEKAPSETNKEVVQWRKSGYYIISSIDYIWNGLSLKQELQLISKELGKNPEEIEKGVPPTAVKDVKDPNNENPVTLIDDTVKDTSVPNSKYTVGDVYTVENYNGVRLLLTITNVLANGTEVTATIKEILPSNNSTPGDFPTNQEVVKNITNQESDVISNPISGTNSTGN